jgi:type I restriction-modification system DNA methylase subunit
MVNERITEEIVRDHFKNDKDYSIVTKEEQKSRNPKINKLLLNASKSGGGCGRPEFIFSFKEHRELLIIVECKADKLKHESETGDQYKDYAVDGVKLYSSFLSKEYDVLSIAISGEMKKDVLISHFLQSKGDINAKPMFGDKLLSIDSYVNGYKYVQDDNTCQKEYIELLKYAKPFNEQLHALKVKESQRSLLISGILIALDSPSFIKCYTDYETPQDLANQLVDTIKTQLGKSLKQEKVDNLSVAYSFIKTHTDFSQKEGVLKELINDVNTNIRPFIKKYPGHDVLGQFYIEFLQYANDDKSLGIVLTPPHITELFSELAMVNKNSIILDNCTGTGGFLISGMKQMIKDAKGDQDAIKQIKEHHLIGIEYQDDIFALACSNMYINGDGRSNIEHGSCFDETIKSRIKSKHPTVGLLNPPYKKKKDDLYEFDFILNNLDLLESGSYCISIIPMGCVLAQSGPELILKEKLLKDHTLEAVFSMPPELFINSNVGVVTCVVVIKAHHPHPIGYETYFGYYIDDGFMKRKTLGRQDYLKKWGAIKDQWITNYRNRKTVAGLSVTRYVTADDEWCAEAYMETDYSAITESEFIKAIKKYVIFKEMNHNEPIS